MAKKYTKSDDLTRHIYERSEYQRRYPRNEANLPGNHGPAQLGNAAFPALKDVVRKDQNRDAKPVPAPGTKTEVVKGESSSASGKSDSRSNPPCAENTDEPSEDLSTNAAAAPVISDPIFNEIFDVPYRDASDSDQDVQLSDAKLLPRSIKEASDSPTEGHDGSLAPENTLSSEQSSQAHLGAPSTRSASQEQQSLAEPRATSRHSTDHDYQGIFPERTVFSGQQNRIQPGAQRSPHRYLGQQSQDQVYSNPRSSTPYGHQGQPSQASLRYQIQPAQRRPQRYLGQRSQDQVYSNPRSSTPYGHQGQPSQAPLRYPSYQYPPPGNVELDPSQTHIPNELQQQRDFQSFPPNMPYPFRRKYR